MEEKPRVENLFKEQDVLELFNVSKQTLQRLRNELGLPT